MMSSSSPSKSKGVEDETSIDSKKIKKMNSNKTIVNKENEASESEQQANKKIKRKKKSVSDESSDTGSDKRMKLSNESKKSNGLDGSEDNDLDNELMEKMVQGHEDYIGKVAAIKQESAVQVSQEFDNSDEDELSPIAPKSNDVPQQENAAITWPEKDLVELVNRIEAHIPENDILSFTTRTEKLNWEDIAFDKYTSEECKSTWLTVQKKQRRFRLLSEVIKDAKEWLATPHSRGNKQKKHPNFPKRPLSSYILFYMHKKDKILKENPGMEMGDLSKMISKMYKALPPNKLEKYSKMAIANREEYHKKVEAFYKEHPEMRQQPTNKVEAKPEPGPKKPNTPFGLFYLNQLQTFEKTDIDKNMFKEKCKELWKSLSDKKKLVWINWAEEEEAKYQEDVKKYIMQNPSYVPVQHVRSLLTKEERQIKERMAGKPVKPPSSAYSYYSQVMLQSEEIRKISPKERMNVIASIWKTISEDKKKMYKEKLAHLTEQYKLDFASYLESLSEEKRQEELMNINPKKRKMETAENNNKGKKKSPMKDEQRKKETVSNNTSNNNAEEVVMKVEVEEDFEEVFKKEPKQPPKTPFAYFSKQYEPEAGSNKTAKEVWLSLPKATRRKYEKELDEVKHAYLQEFKAFLKGMTKAQLKKYKDKKLKEDAEEQQQPSDEEEEEFSEDESSSSASSEEGQDTDED